MPRKSKHAIPKEKLEIMQRIIEGYNVQTSADLQEALKDLHTDGKMDAAPSQLGRGLQRVIDHVPRQDELTEHKFSKPDRQLL